MTGQITKTNEKYMQEISDFMHVIKAKDPHHNDYFQAVYEVAQSVIPFVEENPKYKKAKILERICEPDRLIIFRVCWEDDTGNIQINRGFRVQFNNAIGPYKGGLRFHPSVSLDTFKFLGFEQVFKNSLTTLPMGAAKGGSDFDPKGKSDNEVMRFCQAFMTELIRHIGKDTDVPAGDIGVGAREIGYLFGQHKRLTNRFTGVLTGKSLEYGGSLIRKEATGYGCVFFVQEMLQAVGDSIEGKTCVVSGSGNVAQYTAEKIMDLGGIVVSFSDSGGTVYDPTGFNNEQLEYVKDLKNVKRGRIQSFSDEFNLTYLENQTPWNVPCQLAFPSATQNEIELEDAKSLVKNGCMALGEGANMPTRPDATEYLINNHVLFGPGKAANAGGVAVSGLEMTQNSMRISWDRNDLELRLQEIMKRIHQQCLEFSTNETGVSNYVNGANIAGFKKVADAMISFGIQ